MKQYDTMRDSGYEWIGEIPSHWQVLRMKNVFQNISEKNHPDAEVLSLYREYGVLPKNSRDDNHNVTSENTSAYKFVEINDLVINKMKAWQGSLGISAYEGIVSPAYYVCKIINSAASSKYFHYLLRSKNYAQEYERLSTGMRVGQWDLGINDFMRVPALMPPIDEQEQIAAFLDKQTREIDMLVEEAKKSIEDYRKWKTSIISELVLGSALDCQKRSSGIEWIQNIPSNWKVARLKNLFSFGKGLPITKDNLVEDGIPVISYGQIHAKINPGTEIVDGLIRYVSADYLNTNPESLVHKGDFLIADTSEDTDGCGNAVYVNKDMELFAGYHTIILKSNSEMDNKYLSYLFKTPAWRSQIRARVSGVKLFSISKKILSMATVIMPPEEEREMIVEELDKKCKEIDAVIAEKEALILDLDAYKKSLIYDVITGKRKVV